MRGRGPRGTTSDFVVGLMGIIALLMMVTMVVVLVLDPSPEQQPFPSHSAGSLAVPGGDRALDEAIGRWRDLRLSGVASAPTECVRVYVYDKFIERDEDLNPMVKKFVLSALRDGTLEENDIETVRDAVFGRLIYEGENSLYLSSMRETSQFSLAEIILFRLAIGGGSVRVTRDESEADVFYVPVLSARKDSRKWRERCIEPSIDFHLEHLSERTAHRHLFVIPKGHTVALGDWCDQFWSMRGPKGLPSRRLLLRAMRLSYSDSPRYHLAEGSYLSASDASDFSFGVGWRVWWKRTFSATEFLRRQFRDDFDSMRSQGYVSIFSVPYPSVVHWTPSGGDGAGRRSARFDGSAAPPPWISQHERPLLLSFIGNDGHGEQRDVRRKVKANCDSNADGCLAIDPFILWRSPEQYAGRIPGLISNGTEIPFDIGVATSDHSVFHRVKAASMFCAEPEGDAPGRKSIYDSLLLGCIPVVFSQRTLSLSPLHWTRDWKEDSCVYVDHDEFMSGGIDLMGELASLVRSGAAARMQETIRQNAAVLQYAPDSTAEGDAFDRIFAMAADRGTFISAFTGHDVR